MLNSLSAFSSMKVPHVHKSFRVFVAAFVALTLVHLSLLSGEAALVRLVCLVCIVSTFAKGMWYTFTDGEIFAFWGRFVTKHVPVWIQPTLATCPRCMCSFWGVIAIAWVYFIPAPYVWAIALPCAVGLQEMIDK